MKTSFPSSSPRGSQAGNGRGFQLREWLSRLRSADWQRRIDALFQRDLLWSVVFILCFALLLFRHGVGVDYSVGFQWRPPLSDNIVILIGGSSLQPHQGFRDIYTNKTLWSLFTNVKFVF